MLNYKKFLFAWRAINRKVISLKKFFWFLGLMVLGSNVIWAQGRYRQMDITAGSSYGMGLLGFERMENFNEYSLSYSYWMNDTSTLDISVSYLMSEYQVKVWEGKKSEGETTANWSSLLGTVGVRYQPAWDFFLDFGFGAGIGYEGWWIKSNVFEDRRGDGPVYYLLLDMEYPIREWLSVGLYMKPYYYPLKERLESEVEIEPTGKIDLEYDKLENSWIIVGGGWIKFRIY